MANIATSSLRFRAWRRLLLAAVAVGTVASAVVAVRLHPRRPRFEFEVDISIDIQAGSFSGWGKRTAGS